MGKKNRRAESEGHLYVPIKHRGDVLAFGPEELDDFGGALGLDEIRARLDALEAQRPNEPDLPDGNPPPRGDPPTR